LRRIILGRDDKVPVFEVLFDQEIDFFQKVDVAVDCPFTGIEPFRQLTDCPVPGF
jgi:hypothetical protein